MRQYFIVYCKTHIVSEEIVSISTYTFHCFLFFNKAVEAQKTDSIYHINGDILTGDLKSMAYGVATYKMDGMGTISVEDVKIKSFKSKKLFEIEIEKWEY